MNRKLSVFGVLSFLALVLSLSISSAYTYGEYTSYSSHVSKTEGYYNGPSYTKTTDYNKDTSTKYLPYGGYETTTSYKKTVRETPQYYYPSYNYYSYSPSYGSSDYSYWRYKPAYRSSDYPTNKYGYDYYYSPRLSPSGSYNWRY